MTRPKNAYELSSSQVTTPIEIVSLYWKVMREYRNTIASVIDLGAGDARFCSGGVFQKYTGIEIDRTRIKKMSLPQNATMIHGCAFDHTQEDYDACIGNPPYVRHHDIEVPWREKVLAVIEKELGIRLNRRCNLYLYFLCLGLIKIKSNGIVSVIIPYEWVSRPSAKELRQYVREQRWAVHVYRFQSRIFEDVLTTASITVIDKSGKDGTWKYYDITSDQRILPQRGILGRKNNVLKYENRGPIWAMRGLSPGTQQIFTLTEGERIHFGLRKSDVVPCVTTLRNLPRSIRNLTQRTFQKHYVDSGAKCWLIKSYKEKRSVRLQAYLDNVPESIRQTTTCLKQDPWFNFKPHPVPQLLVSSGFISHGPKIVINSNNIRTVGSVYGVHSDQKLPVRRLQRYLEKEDFENQVVAHAKSLKKIEVKQLNSVLNMFAKAEYE